jgi:hypothetical protein
MVFFTAPIDFAPVPAEYIDQCRASCSTEHDQVFPAAGGLGRHPSRPDSGCGDIPARAAAARGPKAIRRAAALSVLPYPPHGPPEMQSLSRRHDADDREERQVTLLQVHHASE